MTISPDEKEDGITKPWGFKLQNNKRFSGFGMFNNNYYGYDQDRLKVKQFMENFIKEIDEKFSDDRGNITDLHYDIDALASVLNDPENKINKFVSMPSHVELYFMYLISLLTEYSEKIKKNSYHSQHEYIDHIYWYFIDNEGLSRYFPYSFVTRKRNKEIHHWLVFESHPYNILNNSDFTIFSYIHEAHPGLSIQVLPNSHYFTNHTLYLRFIFDLRDEKLKKQIENKSYGGVY
jgi:hypothetical protein